MTLPGDNYAARAIGETAHINRISRVQAKTGRVLMVTGRGGTGKSTFAALASLYLPPPLLLCDIDPDQSLGAMLGVNIENTHITTEAGREAPLKTISDLTRDIVDEDALLELGGGDLGVKLPLLLRAYTQYRSPEFDLISLGPRFTAGDYRAASLLFEFVVPAVGGNYRHIVIDSPAGLEHLNRRVVGKIDDLCIVVDPSAKSLQHIARVKKITRQVGIAYGRLFLVGNCDFDAAAMEMFRATDENFLGQIAFDPQVKEFNLRGQSLRGLKTDSPARESVQQMLAAAGYPVETDH